MANTQSALEKLNKKYGIKSTETSTKSSKSTKNNSKTVIDKLNEKYGIKNTSAESGGAESRANNSAPSLTARQSYKSPLEKSYTTSFRSPFENSLTTSAVENPQTMEKPAIKKSTGEQILDSAGYFGEKLGRGVVDGVENTTDFAWSLLGAAGWGITSGFGLFENKASRAINDWYNDINEDDITDYWGVAENRYDAAPKWVKDWGWLPETIGNLVPFMVETYFSGGSNMVDDVATLGDDAVKAGKSVWDTGKSGWDNLKRIGTNPDVHFGMSAAGGATEEAIKKGANPVTATTYGTAAGALEVASEKLFGGYAGTGIGKAGTTAIKETTDTTNKTLLRKIWNSPVTKKVLDIGAEGVEEQIVTFGDPVLQRATGVDTKAEWASYSDYVESGTHGVILSVVMNAVGMPISKYGKSKTISSLNESTEVLNELMQDDTLKLKPLTSDAPEAEIVKRKKEVAAVALAFDNAVKKAVQGEQQTDFPTEWKKRNGINEQIQDPLEQAAREVVEKRNRKGTPIYERLEALSQNNEPIAVEDVKNATGFGNNGAELVAEYSNVDGETFDKVLTKVKPAYLEGFNNPDFAVGKMENEQMAAFKAGQIDRKTQDLEAEIRAKKATVYNGAFTENEYTKNWTPAEQKMVSTVAKSFGMDIGAVDKIIANVIDEVEYEANAEHQDGKMRISSAAEKVIHTLVIHEGGHRMRQLAPAEFDTLMNALYERAVQRGVKAGASKTAPFDFVKAEHDNAGITMGTSDYIEEIAVRELETIFGSAEEFNKWYDEISGNKQVKNAWQRFVDWVIEVIENIKNALANAKLTKAERLEAKKALNELERIKELYTNAYKAAENAVVERRISKHIEIEAKESYNENRNYSLKDFTENGEKNNVMSVDDVPDKKDYIAYVPVTKVKMKTFPPYNESESDANEWSTRWAHREDVETGAQTLMFYHNRCYVIEKYDSTDLKYQIEGRISYKAYEAIRKELEEDARNREKQHQKKMVDFLRERNERRNTDEGRGQGLDYSPIKHGGKNREVLRLDGKQDGKRGIQSDLGGSDEYNGKNRQTKSVDEDKRFSLKGGMPATELFDTVDDARKGNKSAIDKLSKYVESGAMPTELYKELIENYGEIAPGEKPAREVHVPKKTAKDKKVSQTVRTILEAKATPDEAVPTIEKMVEDGVFSYDVYTDKQAIKDAEENLKTKGWVNSLNDWLKAVDKGEVSKELTTQGWALYNNAANTVATTTTETERRDAIQASLTILDAMVRHQRSAAQALQATRILKQLSPETQLYGIQKSVEQFQKEITDKYGKKAPDLKIDEELAEKFLTAKTEDARLEAEKEIYKDIGRQMPSNWLDKWNAWRYLAMLGNPRTHIRNILGNAVFAPVVGVKNLTATAIESIVYRVSDKKILRGKALVWGSKTDRELLKAAWGDYANVADMVSNGGKYNDSAIANQYIEDGRKILPFKSLEGARKGNSKLLEIEDVWFSKPHYAYALAQYCKANNITAEQIARGKAIGPAREYAIKEAQKATYKDTNAFSQMVSEWGRSNKNEKNIVKKAFNTAIEGILPFRKTPANILVRGVEYSPLGLLKGLADIRKLGKGEMTATEFIDNISAGLTGTGLLGLGVYLAAQGLIRGHGEEEKDEKDFKELMGHQSYSLELPNGQSITLDWLAPEALPFFVGVNLWEATHTNKEMNLSSILQAISSISEPLLEMSCLQSLNDLFESVGYAASNDTSGLVSVLSSAVTSYLTQGIPTIFGQAERTSEENRMTTYTEKNSFLTDDMQYTLGKASAKIPFWDYNQIPYIDAWGRKEASGTALKRGFNNFLNPAYTSTIESSKMEKELLRLYGKTGEAGVFPERADKYFTVDGERRDLTADEYVRYATLKGEKSYKLITDLVKSKAYKGLSDGEKVKTIKEAYDYANQKAKQATSNYKPDAWVGKADAFGNVGTYISFKTKVKSAKDSDDCSKQQVIDIILDMAQNDSEMWKLYLSEYDAKKDIAAFKTGVEGGKYMNALQNLDECDKPNKSGKLGTYTNEEVSAAISMTDGLTNQERAELWQAMTGSASIKNNPWQRYLP